ncbi:MAG TPA: alpha-amylase, partial [Albitalea sp.]|nr:alpha-amylase [Albitalea sp.]
LAAATYLLQPGIPFIYYGEEVGLAGPSSLSGDWKLRTPMSWTGNTSNAGFSTGTPFRAVAGNVATHNVAAERADPNSILSFYKAMIALRNTLPSIARGSYESPVVSGSTLAFRRVLGAERSLVVINYGTSGTMMSVTGLPANAVFSAAYPSGAAGVTADAGGTAMVAVGAQSVVVLKQN